MKRLPISLLLVFILLAVGCATIKGSTKKEQRQYVLDMRDTTMKRLYAEQPIAKEQVKDAAGYGVFSNINTNLFLLSTGSGFGVVTAKKDKETTIMKMASVGGGLGIGLKDFRAVIIFRNHDDMQKFIQSSRTIPRIVISQYHTFLP